MQSSTVNLNKLQQLKEELKTWRSQKTGHKRIPQYLWDKAFELLNIYPVGLLSRELRLDHNKLRKHLLSSNNKAAHKSSGPKEAFIELSASDLANSASQAEQLSDSLILSRVTQSCRIIFERADGSRLTLNLATDWPKIEAICNRFLRG